jgi:hypothetical protein
MYGIYNTKAKQWQFGIKEPSRTKAKKALFNKIGNDAYKWRFEIRKINPKQSKYTPISCNDCKKEHYFTLICPYCDEGRKGN